MPDLSPVLFVRPANQSGRPREVSDESSIELVAEEVPAMGLLIDIVRNK